MQDQVLNDAGESFMTAVDDHQGISLKGKLNRNKFDNGRESL